MINIKKTDDYKNIELYGTNIIGHIRIIFVLTTKNR